LALSERQEVENEEGKDEHYAKSADMKKYQMQSTLHRRSVDQFRAQLIARAAYVFHNEDSWFSIDLSKAINLCHKSTMDKTHQLLEIGRQINVSTKRLATNAQARYAVPAWSAKRRRRNAAGINHQ
jgi:hypothetical protein